jgi:hypothetical protein
VGTPPDATITVQPNVAATSIPPGSGIGIVPMDVAVPR